MLIWCSGWLTRRTSTKLQFGEGGQTGNVGWVYYDYVRMCDWRDRKRKDLKTQWKYWKYKVHLWKCEQEPKCLWCSYDWNIRYRPLRLYTSETSRRRRLTSKVKKRTNTTKQRNIGNSKNWFWQVIHIYL